MPGTVGHGMPCPYNPAPEESLTHQQCRSACSEHKRYLLNRTDTGGDTVVSWTAT